MLHSHPRWQSCHRRTDTSHGGDTLSTERASIRLFRIIDMNIVQIQATCLRSVRFFLFDISHTVTLAKSFQCFTQITETDLRKLLVGYPIQVDTTFKVTYFRFSFPQSQSMSSTFTRE